jgi:hypothetical protein
MSGGLSPGSQALARPFDDREFADLTVEQGAELAGVRT